MKKLLVALAAVLVTVASYGQGQINFNNFSQNGGAGAPIWDVGQTGTKGPGAGVTAGLFLVNSGVATLIPNATTDFFTQAGADFFITPINVTVPGVGSGGQNGLTFEVRAWSTAAGSYDAARLNPLYKFGTSGNFTGDVGPDTLPPNNLNNLTSFTLQQVPEPSTIALGVIGGLALLLRRRK